MRTFEERFWAKVDTSGDCWEWTAGKGAKGYGQIGEGGRGGRMLYAHRVSFELASGPIPGGLSIDHICHNRGCVRPEHLRLATAKQNAENLSGLRKDNTSGVRGVFWNKANRNWRATICHNGALIYVGSYSTLAEAEAAVLAKRNELFTHNDLDRRQ